MSSTAAAIAPAVTSAPVKANGPDGGGGAGEVGSMVDGGDVEGEGEGLGVWSAVTSASSVSVTTGPVGGVPATLPTLVMLPASRSAWVVV